MESRNRTARRLARASNRLIRASAGTRAEAVNTKAKGSRNERRSRDLLEAAGYRVTRAAGSLGPWDLVGLGPTGAVVVQVKTEDWPSTAEREALAEFPAWPYVTKLIHRWRARQRPPDVQEL